MSCKLESDDEYLDEMMDVNFPMPSSSDGEGTNDDWDLSVPFIDIMSGWDNNAIDRCFRMTLESYNNTIESNFEFEPKPNSKLSLDKKAAVPLDPDKSSVNGETKSDRIVSFEDTTTKDDEHSATKRNIFEGWTPKSMSS